MSFRGFSGTSAAADGSVGKTQVGSFLRPRDDASGVPADVTFKRKRELGLDIIDRAKGWGLPEGVIVTDAGYGVATEFREQLWARTLLYVVGITGDVRMWRGKVTPQPMPYQGFGRPRKARTSTPETAAVSYGLWR